MDAVPIKKMDAVIDLVNVQIGWTRWLHEHQKVEPYGLMDHLL